jgi:type I restriction enzyme S subunit
VKEVNSLPKGWIKATVGDIAGYVNGFAFKPAHWEESGTPIIRIQNLTNPDKPFNYTKINVLEAYEINNGDLLVSWSATLDAFVWRGEKAWLNQHISKVVPEPRLFDKGLLFYWMKVAIAEMINTEHLHGSTMKHINRGPFLAHATKIPPFKEQIRIIEKLDELFSELDAGVKELKSAQIKLTQYRQSLLKSAVGGSLTQIGEKQTVIAFKKQANNYYNAFLMNAVSVGSSKNAKSLNPKIRSRQKTGKSNTQSQ